MNDVMIALSITIATIGAGLMAGVYFAFSAFIMASFNQLDAAHAVDAMNAINKRILRSWFMPLFFGTSLLHLLLAIWAFLNWSDPYAPLLFITGFIYFTGMFLCTVFFNVPLNDQLATPVESDIHTSQFWSRYYRCWTRWNHLRAASSLVACVLGVYLLTT